MSATVANAKNSVRKDPSKRRRLVTGSLWKVKSKNPDKRFCWVYENNSEFGVQYYEAAGYDVERNGQDVSLGKVVGDGDVIRMNGHVLMSIDKEDFEDIQQRGMDGESGQNLTDSIDRIIHNAGIDSKDLKSRVAHVVNETGPTRTTTRVEEQPEG